MKKRLTAQSTTWLSALALILSTVGCGSLRRAPRVPRDYALKAKVIQRLKSFDNSEGAVFSADGKYVFISNAAELGKPDKGVHFIEHGGFISKLEVQPDGKLKMLNRKLLEGLTGPLGMAVLPKATKVFPAGTIFVCKGNLPMAEPDGTRITDSARLNSEIIAFDVKGEPLGAISWGKYSLLAEITGAPATQPNGMAFDKDGNLYVAETGMGGESLVPPLLTMPGVMMIPHGAIDDLASEKKPKDMPLFIRMPGGPDGVAVCPTDQCVYVNTVGLAAGIGDADKGATFRLRKSDFAAGVCPKPIASGFGALDGLTFLPNGTRLETQVLHDPNYIMATLPGKEAMRVPLQPDVKFTACADIAVRRMADGSYLLVIPQLSPLAPNRMRDEVVVAKLPKEFGTMPARKPKARKKPASEKKAASVKEKPKAKTPKPKPKKAEIKAAPARVKPKPKKVETKAAPARKPAPPKPKPKPKKVETKAAPAKKPATPKPKPAPKKVETKVKPAKAKPKAKTAAPKPKPKPKKVETKAAPAKKPATPKPKPASKKVETKVKPAKAKPKAKTAAPKPKPKPKKVETKAAPAKEKPKAKKAEPEKKEKKPFLFFFSDKAKKKREARKKKKEEKEPFLFFFGKRPKKKTEPEEKKPESEKK